MPDGTDARLVRRPLGWRLAREDVLRLVRTDAHPVALFGEWAGRGGDVIASEPVRVRSAPGAIEDVFDAPFPARAADTPADGGLAGGVFAGGWIGYLGYSAGGEALPVSGPRRLPAWWFGWYDHVLRRDAATGEWFFEALWTDERAAVLDRRFADLTARPAVSGGGGPTTAPGYDLGPFRLVPAAAGHREAVRKTVEYIHAGDIFQANICLRMEAGFAGDPLDAFCQAAARLNPPYASFIGVSATGTEVAGVTRTAVASLSPELFLRRERATVTSKPIKGTARRAADEREAAAQRAELEESAKNQAENVMIVDLVRNDLSRVCVPGTVTVPVLLGSEPHPGVWHLVSAVTGTLSPDAGDGDLIRAAFPPGSVTGAPKVRALEIIDELEAAPREVYTGAVGYRSPQAGLELNVAIRTFEFAAGKAWLGAGGGIVADSAPEAEYAECLIKATPLLEAIGATLDTTSPGPAPDLRPRQTAGVFTSLEVTNGETRGLDAHLARLAASARALYAKDLPVSLPAALADCLSARPAGRLRITVRPVGGPLQATVEVVPITPRPAPPSPGIRLRPAVVPGGIGPHKYKDRRLIDELGHSGGLQAGEQVLITDETGEILETDRANIFAVIDGVLLTPPADGRLLPGITRAAVMRAAHSRGIRVGQKPVTLGELADATEVFVTNAVTGVLPVTKIETCQATWPAQPPGPVTATLKAALGARAADRPQTLAAPPGPDVRLLRAARLSARPPAARPLVILVDNYDSFTWNLAHLLTTAGARVEVIRNDEVTAAQVMAAEPDAVVISPGPCAPAEAGISIATVRAAAAAGVPLLGICLGHQAIGAAFGARIIRAPRPVHGQAFPVSHDGRGVLSGLPDPFQATRYHSLIVDEATLPPDLEITARTGPLPMAVRHRTRPIEGVQFHPESILTTHGDSLIRNFVEATDRRG
jgi:para-aminobenzoate synthetase/4-amino-4-deoxychorismate lyase